MGISNNAILAFGFAMGDEVELPECLNIVSDNDDEEIEDSYETFDDMVVAKSGLAEPEGVREYDNGNNSPAWKEYYKKVDEIKATCPIELVWYCSCDYPMYFIALKNTKETALRGYVEKVSMREIRPEEIVVFKDFCKKYEIEYEDPAWSIFSMNG